MLAKRALHREYLGHDRILTCFFVVVFLLIITILFVVPVRIYFYFDVRSLNVKNRCCLLCCHYQKKERTHFYELLTSS